MHGLAPALVFADEPAQWVDSTAERAIAALRTGLGKVPGSRLIALGTRPLDDPHHWFGAMLAGGADYSQVHAAGPDDPPFQRRTMAKGKPESRRACRTLRRACSREAADARSDPAMMAAFRALRLNAGTADTLEAVLLAAGTWERVEGDVEAAGEYVLGVDLGGAAAMSAAAGYWPESGRLDALGCFPSIPDLRERGLADGVGRRYLDMERRGELIHGGRARRGLPRATRRPWPSVGAGPWRSCDRWRIAELRDACDHVG